MYIKISILIFYSAMLALETAEGATLQYHSSYEHSSASQTHYLAIGARATFKYVSLELSNGLKKAQRGDRNANKLSNGTQLGIHLYPIHSIELPNRFVISIVHLSDIFRGKPFNDKEEPVDHFFGAGYTLRRNNYEIDLLVGKESHDCSLDRGCQFRNQFKTTIRYVF